MNSKQIIFTLTTRGEDSNSDYSPYTYVVKKVYDSEEVIISSVKNKQNHLPFTEGYFLKSAVLDYHTPCYKKESGVIIYNPNGPDSFNFFVKTPRIRSKSRIDFTGRVISDVIQIATKGLTHEESLIFLFWTYKNFFVQFTPLDDWYENPFFKEGKPNLNKDKIRDFVSALLEHEISYENNFQESTFDTSQTLIRELLFKKYKPVQTKRSKEPPLAQIREIKSSLDENITNKIPHVGRQLVNFTDQLFNICTGELNFQIPVFPIATDSFVSYLQEHTFQVLDILNNPVNDQDCVIVYFNPDLKEVKKISSQFKQEIDCIICLHS
ncbi:hypothetical protein FEK30_01940 [Picosynechococcus sp. PCC 11901]|uniref:hypothetical protein n=1 Tax=Picosynechococcus sp. PCC 11901 TaxID=2579791 RepID=UPI0010FC0DE8|nr:hypothetical protein [Picosynechococcus sp. PCC 11901]QCS48295.1 hypothetical protein FEK30_01940 [Picosynechococcus sp. PCC 11901]